jgi:hypothetical protein
MNSTSAARTPEQGQLHRARIGIPIDDGAIGESAGQVADKLVGPGESNLGIAHAKGRHTLKQEHGIGHRDFQIRLLQAVAETGVEDLDFSDVLFRHLFLQSIAFPQVFLPLGQKNLTFPSYRGSGFRALQRQQQAQSDAEAGGCGFEMARF